MTLCHEVTVAPCIPVSIAGHHYTERKLHLLSVMNAHCRSPNEQNGEKRNKMSIQLNFEEKTLNVNHLSDCR